jgi:FkbM family methyltransferase
MQSFAQFLFKYVFFIYRPLYWIFKNIVDKENILFFKTRINKGDTVLDIGANIGFTSEIFSKQTGTEGKVFSFEPDTTNFKHLNKLITKSKFVNVVLINKAVSDQSGVLKFYTSPNLNVDHRAYQVNEYASVTEIPCTSIDDFVIENNIYLNFIKIDIQGYEYQAFLGMKNAIQSNPSLIIFTEFWPFALNTAGYSAEKLISLWKELNLFIYKIKGNKLMLVSEKEILSYCTWPKHKFCNFVLCKNKLD